MAGEEKKFCFVISPIKDPVSLERKHADTVLEYIIRPALEADYTVKRADEDQRPGQITNQMIRDIVDADLIVANLSGLNPNVMYELGIAHALKKKVIHLIDDKTGLPFDLSHSRAILFDVADPISHSKAADQLAAQARKVAGVDVVSNPFSDALAEPQKFDIEELKALAVGDLMASINSLKDRLSALETGRSKPSVRDIPTQWDTFIVPDIGHYLSIIDNKERESQFDERVLSINYDRQQDLFEVKAFCTEQKFLNDYPLFKGVKLKFEKQ